MTGGSSAAGRERTGARAPLVPEEVEAALRGVGVTGRISVLATTPSTSAEATARLAAEPDAWPDRSLVVADHQGAGRGRRGRTWTTPPGAAVTVSVVLRPDGVPMDRWSWLPLLGGLAVVETVAQLPGVRAGLKWPNDVLVEVGDELPGWGTGRKLAGVLAEVVATPTGPAVVVGIGVNVDQTPLELPVASATSLATVAGAAPARTDLLASLVGRLIEHDRLWRQDGAVRSGLAARCAQVCLTLGQPVSVELPGGAVVQGTARGLGADGSLEVVDDAGRLQGVHAGDVHHVRRRS